MPEQVKVTVTNSYVFKLSLGANIEDKSKASEILNLSQDSKGKGILIDGLQCTIVLNGVKYTRKIYEPGLIEAEVTILKGDSATALPAMTAVKDLFLKRTAKLTITHKETKKEES